MAAGGGAAGLRRGGGRRRRGRGAVAERAGVGRDRERRRAAPGPPEQSIVAPPQPAAAPASATVQSRAVAVRAALERGGSAGQSGHAAAAGRALVEVQLGGLVAPVAEAQVLDRPRQLRQRRRKRQQLAHRLQRLARSRGPCRSRPGSASIRISRPEDGPAGGISGAWSFGANRSKGPRRKYPLAARMRLLVFHGYLLGGTGSNVYNAELAAALARAGHEVHLLCQDRDPLAPRLGRRGRRLGRRDELRVHGAPRRGARTVYRPDLGGLLPGLRGRPLRGRRGAPVPGAQRGGARSLPGGQRRRGPRGRRAGPAGRRARQSPRDGPGDSSRGRCATRSRTRSRSTARALEYTVKPHPRFMPYAVEGLGRGAVGSRHTAESLWKEMADPQLPGAPASASTSTASRRASRPRRAPGSRSCAIASPAAPATHDPESSFARGAARRSPRSAPSARTTGWFVGKLIASKGVELLLAALPLVLAREPRRGWWWSASARSARVSSSLRRACRGRHSTPRPPPARRTGGSSRNWRRSSRVSRTRTPTARPRPAWATGSRRAARPLRARRPVARRRGDGGYHLPGSAWSPPRRRAAARLPVVSRPLRPRRGRPYSPPLPRRRKRGSPSRCGPAPSRSSPPPSRPACRPRGRAPRRAPAAIVAATRERYSWAGVARTVIAAAQAATWTP